MYNYHTNIKTERGKIMDNNARWITNKDFSDLSPINVFHKEMDKQEKNYDENLLNSHILFRKEFDVNFKKESYSIDITADDYYRLYINGEFVCSGPAPCYPWHYYYNTVDISKYIHEGKNVIAVHTFYQGMINRVWVSADRRHGLICTLYENNEVLIVSDETFKCQKHQGYSYSGIAVERHDTLFNEIYISGTPEENFESLDFDDSNWCFASLNRYNDRILFKQETKTLDYYAILPRKIEKIEGGYRIDTEQEIVGYLTAEAIGRKGDKITVRYAEELDDNGYARYNMRCKCHYEDTWVLSGGTDTFKPFDYKGFRYVELISDNEFDLNIDSVKIIVRHYPFVSVRKCPIKNVRIERIWKLCENTIKYGTQDCFVDCPTREKGQYLGDVCISAIANAILTGKCDMLKKSIRNFADSSRICKGLMAVSTSSFMQEIADYSMLFPMTVLWYYKLTEDVEFLKEMIPTLNGLVSYFKEYEREDGLIEKVTEKWNLVDWPENLRDGYAFPLSRPIGDGCHNVINAFYIGMHKCINEIYSICGIDKIDLSHYEQAYIKEFFNDKLNIFTDSKSTEHAALHSNVLPLLFKIKTNDTCKSNIIELIKEKGLTSSGTYFSYFIMQALKNENEIQLLLELITDEKAWLNMLDENATTTFEAWGKEQKHNSSLFHPWSCTPLLILYDL